MKLEKLQKRIIQLRPWGHEILLPYDLVTARPPYTKETYPGEKNIKEYTLWPKFVYLTESGAFEGLSPPAKVIDLGCSSGWFSIYFAQQGYRVVAIDKSLKAIEQVKFVKGIYQLNNLSVLRGDISTLRWGFDNFDLILMLGLIHHLDEEDQHLVPKWCYEALKVGGVIVVETKPEIPCQELLEYAGFTVKRLKLKKGRAAWRGDRK